jgi:hypothetical protein
MQTPVDRNLDEHMAHHKQRQTTDKRLKAILRGAFAGSPTPPKEIPTKKGESPPRARNRSGNVGPNKLRQSQN